MKGLVVFSRSEEGRKWNRRLARAVARIIEKESEKLLVIAQWGVACELSEMGYEADHVVGSAFGVNLGSRSVWDQSRDFLAWRRIDDVIPVAQSLQRLRAMWLIDNHGYNVVYRRVGWIGFDRFSISWLQ
jgi:hypothetical protein